MKDIQPRDWQLTGEQPMTPKQRRMLNAVCGDLENQLDWHGFRLNKDAWRHFFSGLVLGQRILPGWDYGDARPAAAIILGRSSLDLSVTKAAEAITMAVHLGDEPSSQGMKSQPVRWSDVVLMGMGFNPDDFGDNTVDEFPDVTDDNEPELPQGWEDDDHPLDLF